MKNKYYWAIWIIIGIFMFIIAFLSKDYFYNMTDTNCKSIMSSFDVPTEDYVSCQKFYNYPFWEFDFGYWFIYGVIHILLGVIILFIGILVEDGF